MVFVGLILAFGSCNTISDVEKQGPIHVRLLDSLVTQWHQAAAEANAAAFFGFMHPTAIYIGTDATERWTKNEFVTFAKPYFDKGKAWDFKTIERKCYTKPEITNMAWFDETLDTWMGICRASGILVFENQQWTIIHYHLSLTVPNQKVKQVIDIINPTHEPIQ